MQVAENRFWKDKDYFLPIKLVRRFRFPIIVYKYFNRCLPGSYSVSCTERFNWGEWHDVPVDWRKKWQRQGAAIYKKVFWKADRIRWGMTQNQVECSSKLKDFLWGLVTYQNASPICHNSFLKIPLVFQFFCNLVLQIGHFTPNLRCNCLKMTRLKFSMNEVQSACLAGTVKSWSTAARTLLDSAAYISHWKSYYYLVSKFRSVLHQNTLKCM